jgi:hypothetical protein
MHHDHEWWLGCKKWPLELARRVAGVEASQRALDGVKLGPNLLEDGDVFRGWVAVLGLGLDSTGAQESCAGDEERKNGLHGITCSKFGSKKTASLVEEAAAVW